MWKLKVPLRRRRKKRSLEISLCESTEVKLERSKEVSNNKQVASPAGLDEEYSWKENSSCKLSGLGGNGICLRKKQGQCFKSWEEIIIKGFASLLELS